MKRPSKSLKTLMLAGATSGVLLLSGCGSSSLSPGVAATVGDDEITSSTLRTASQDWCDALDLASSAETAGARVRDSAMLSLVFRQMGEQLRDEYDITPSSNYSDLGQQIRTELADLDSDTLDRAVTELTGADYFVDIVSQIGADDLGIDLASDQQQQGLVRGLEIAKEWEADHPIETVSGVNTPTFAVPDQSQPNVFGFERTDVSVAVSSFATDALTASDPDADAAGYAEQLPASQKCGGAEVDEPLPQE